MDKMSAWKKLFKSREEKENGKTWWTLLSEVMNKNDDCVIALKSSFPEISDETLPIRFLWGALFEITQRLDALCDILVPIGETPKVSIIDEYPDMATEQRRANELAVNYCCKLWSGDSKERILEILHVPHGDRTVLDMEVQNVYETYIEAYFMGKKDVK